MKKGKCTTQVWRIIEALKASPKLTKTAGELRNELGIVSIHANIVADYNYTLIMAKSQYRIKFTKPKAIVRGKGYGQATLTLQDENSKKEPTGEQTKTTTGTNDPSPSRWSQDY